MDRTDEELIEQTVSGSTDSFDELMQRYERLVFKVAYSFGGTRENALDITQTVFLKAFSKLTSFRTDSSFKTWLLRITYNEGINWTRSSRNRPELHDELDPVSETFASGADQEATLLDQEQRRLLERGLETLNERYRTAIVLRYLHEMPIREIAGVLQCSENMTKNILFRGVRNLRKSLVDAT